jgi:hypothetical protein
MYKMRESCISLTSCFISKTTGIRSILLKDDSKFRFTNGPAFSSCICISELKWICILRLTLNLSPYLSSFFYVFLCLFSYLHFSIFFRLRCCFQVLHSYRNLNSQNFPHSIKENTCGYVTKNIHLHTINKCF